MADWDRKLSREHVAGRNWSQDVEPGVHVSEVSTLESCHLSEVVMIINGENYTTSTTSSR